MTTPNIDTKALRELLERLSAARKVLAENLDPIARERARDAVRYVSGQLVNAAPALLDLAERAQEQAKEIETLREVERAVRERGMPGALDFYREGRDEAERRVWAANETAREQIARCDAALAEAEKWRTAARVLCGAHVGLPQSTCPVCERDALKAEVAAVREKWDQCIEHLGAAANECSALKDRAREAWSAMLDIDAKNKALEAKLSASEREAERLRATVGPLTVAVRDMEHLVGSSRGVAGLHLNGDEAPWDELTGDGCLNGWLGSLTRASAALRGEEGN